MKPERESQPEPLSAVDHRPFPPPQRPWTMRQRWQDLLFAHWPLPPTEIASLLPTGLQVDTFDKSAWLGVVPFCMDHIQMRGLPTIPGARQTPELNFRTYVRERNTNRTGVYFFSLEASNPLAVAIARIVFHLPYHWSRISARARGDREITYQSERLLSARPVRFRAHYRGLGRLTTLEPSRPGTLEHFLTERYCFFTTNRQGRLLSGDIHHTPWPLEAAEAEIEWNDLPATYGIRLPTTEPVLHYSRELVVYLWSLNSAPEPRWKGLEAAGARPAESV